MASMLQKCPGCGVMIAIGHACPECHWTEARAEEPAADAAPEDGNDEPRERAPAYFDLAEEYGRRETQHIRNYAIFMVLMLGTGLIGLLTAYMWFRFIFFGDIIAFIRIGLLTLVTGGLSVLLKYSKKLFPTDLNCPACDARIDQLGLINDHCPSCSAQLKQKSVPVA